MKIAFHSLKIVFILSNSIEPGEMPHYAVFYLGLGVIIIQRVNKVSFKRIVCPVFLMNYCPKIPRKPPKVQYSSVDKF